MNKCKCKLKNPIITCTWGTIVQQQASRQKRNLKVDLGKCVQMYRAPFLYLPGAPNSLNPPLTGIIMYNLTSSEHKGRNTIYTALGKKFMLLFYIQWKWMGTDDIKLQKSHKSTLNAASLFEYDVLAWICGNKLNLTRTRRFVRTRG